MIYQKNKTYWRKGDTVIHDADAKESKMLMIVTNVLDCGCIQTRYHDRSISKELFYNKKEALHDPSRFGIVVGEI